MTNDDNYPAGHGHAWRADWRRRLATLLAAQGDDSVTRFLAARPRRSLVELARTLGGGGDVAGVQLEWAAIDEAKASGPVAIEQCARDLLVRVVHEYMPNGWDHNDDRALRGAFGGWATSLAGPEDPGTADTGGASTIAAPVPPLSVWKAIAVAVPAGWAPTDANDAILTEVFRKVWR